MSNVMTPRADAHRCPAGITLVEMMLSLCVCALLGGGVLGIISTTLQATDNQHAAQDDTMRQTVIRERLSAALRGTAVVLDTDSSSLLVWRGDLNLDQQVNLSEIGLIQWDAAAGELWLYQASASLAPADDAAYDPDDDLGTSISGLLGGGLMPGYVLADQVVGFTIALEGAAAGRPTLCTVALDFADRDDQADMELNVALRCDDPRE